MNIFKIDQQTKDDLEIFKSSTNENSVFSYFDFTSTLGGRDLLKNIFKNPTNNFEELQNRISLINYFLENSIDLSFKSEVIDYIEFYLRHNDRPSSYSVINALENSFRYFFRPDQRYYLKERGVYELLDLLKFLKDYFFSVDNQNCHKILEKLKLLLNTVSNHQTIKKCLNKRPLRLSKLEIEKCDFAIRGIYVESFMDILNIIYKLDVFNTVARVSKNHQLTIPAFDPSGKIGLNLHSVFHLFLKNPVKNDVTIDSGKNVCFITGVNMSGKSTIIKSIAIAVYLAHLGFPVPAKKMETNVFNGLLTTINLSDNLIKGHSHFYSEVLRLKSISETVSNTNNVLVIFDELFKGTNVKDAFDASLSVIDLFTKIDDNFFIISSHIIEVANELSENNKIKFQFFKTTLENKTILFNYKLLDGMTGDRIGLWIIKNEGILDILENKIHKLTKSKNEV